MSDNFTPSYAVPVVGFLSRKAAQLSAYFALQSGGMIEKLKLIKLIYLAERKFLGQNHHPMLFDEFYSLPHGPICSSTLNGIDGIINDDIWSDYVARNGNIIVSLKNFLRDDLDEISDAEVTVADEIWQEFGGMTASALRNYSHSNCSEYTEITKGRIPISYRNVLEALGDMDADEVDREIREMRCAESILLVK